MDCVAPDRRIPFAECQRHATREPASARRRRNVARICAPIPRVSNTKPALMEEDMVKLPNGERRVALGKRRRVAEMSPEEMQRELLTFEVTGLPNRRAFDEAGV